MREVSVQRSVLPNTSEGIPPVLAQYKIEPYCWFQDVLPAWTVFVKYCVHINWWSWSSACKRGFNWTWYVQVHIETTNSCTTSIGNNE